VRVELRCQSIDGLRDAIERLRDFVDQRRLRARVVRRVGLAGPPLRPPPPLRTPPPTRPPPLPSAPTTRPRRGARRPFARGRDRRGQAVRTGGAGARQRFPVHAPPRHARAPRCSANSLLPLGDQKPNVARLPRCKKRIPAFRALRARHYPSVVSVSRRCEYGSVLVALLTHSGAANSGQCATSRTPPAS